MKRKFWITVTTSHKKKTKVLYKRLTLLVGCDRRKSTRICSPPMRLPFMFLMAWDASSNLRYSTNAVLRSLRNLKSSTLPNLRNSSSNSSLETAELIPPTHRCLEGFAWKVGFFNIYKHLKIASFDSSVERKLIKRRSTIFGFKRPIWYQKKNRITSLKEKNCWYY